MGLEVRWYYLETRDVKPLWTVNSTLTKEYLGITVENSASRSSIVGILKLKLDK